MGFIEKVENYIDANELLDSGDGVVIGLSGGADSVSLLLALCALRDKRNLKLAAVHLNHMIRGEEADRDEDFAGKLCEEKNVEFFSFKKDIPLLAKEEGLSEEEAGRKVRYELFEKVRFEKGFNKIAVAHNRNDLAETVLFNMARGSSLKGISGICARRGRIIRPILGITREEIEEYLSAEGQKYVTDSTNSEMDYSRNLIRHTVLPGLSQVNSGAVFHIAKAAEDVNEIYSFIEEEAAKIEIKSPDGQKIHININDLNGAMKLVRYEVYLRAMECLAGKRKDITRLHLRLVDELTELPNGRSLDMPYEITVRKSYDKLVFEKKAAGEAAQGSSVIDISGEGEYILDNSCLEVKICDYSENIVIPRDEYNKIFDYDRICGKLCFRYAEKDDHIKVTADGSKKLSRVFTDKKIDRKERNRVPVLACGNEIIWAVGVRFSEGFKVDSSTKKVMILKYNYFPEER